SLGLINDKFFITLAYHQMKTTKLATGFAVGDVLPEDFPGEIPTREKTVSGVLLGFTYKIQ
ncbi:MAG: hypothetical protein KDJ38_09125, partial [Gammaproteobacteria bacterium]|nr:hypothetical protein [Gammaproteobacteria bacterium]